MPYGLPETRSKCAKLSNVLDDDDFWSAMPDPTCLSSFTFHHSLFALVVVLFWLLGARGACFCGIENLQVRVALLEALFCLFFLKELNAVRIARDDAKCAKCAKRSNLLNDDEFWTAMHVPTCLLPLAKHSISIWHFRARGCAFPDAWCLLASVEPGFALS